MLSSVWSLGGPRGKLEGERREGQALLLPVPPNLFVNGLTFIAVGTQRWLEVPAAQGKRAQFLLNYQKKDIFPLQLPLCLSVCYTRVRAVWGAAAPFALPAPRCGTRVLMWATQENCWMSLVSVMQRVHQHISQGSGTNTNVKVSIV